MIDANPRRGVRLSAEGRVDPRSDERCSAAVGESLISPHIAGKVLQHVRATTAAPEAAATIRAELGDREIQVLKLIANGKDNAMIAGELHISPKTVKHHISNILMKLQIENRIQAAVYAVRSESSSPAPLAGRLPQGRARLRRPRVARGAPAEGPYFQTCSLGLRTASNAPGTRGQRPKR